MIVESEPEGSDLGGIVLCLGGFHTEMNFLGCIGNLMDFKKCLSQSTHPTQLFTC